MTNVWLFLELLCFYTSALLKNIYLYIFLTLKFKLKKKKLKLEIFFHNCENQTLYPFLNPKCQTPFSFSSLFSISPPPLSSLPFSFPKPTFDCHPISLFNCLSQTLPFSHVWKVDRWMKWFYRMILIFAYLPLTISLYTLERSPKRTVASFN